VLVLVVAAVAVKWFDVTEVLVVNTCCCYVVRRHLRCLFLLLLLSVLTSLRCGRVLYLVVLVHKISMLLRYFHIDFFFLIYLPSLFAFVVVDQFDRCCLIYLIVVYHCRGSTVV
jgi:hypothetical protein